MRQLALTPGTPADATPPKRPALDQEPKKSSRTRSELPRSSGGDSTDCKTSALAATILPQAVLQPAALLSKELGASRRQQEPKADRGDLLPPSSLRPTRPEPPRGRANDDFQPIVQSRVAAPKTDSWEPQPPRRDQPSTPSPNEDWTWEQDDLREAALNRAARREEDEDVAGGLSRLDQAVQSDVARARAALTEKWEHLRSKWKSVENPRIRRLRWVAIAAMVVLFTPVGGQLWSAAAGGMEYVGDESRTRAAFQFIEDFQDGILAQWDAEGLAEDDESTAVRAGSLTLFQETMNLTDYFMDFDFVLDRPAVGWVVRANDRDSYCAFKLERTGKKNDLRYKLVRYAVIDGEIDPKHQIDIDVTPDFREEGLNRISVRIAGTRINTFLNGRGVDFWNDKFFHEGGVGFWSEDGSSAQIHRVAVYGNEDFWGLTLFAALEAAHRVKVMFSGDAGPGSGPAQARM